MKTCNNQSCNKDISKYELILKLKGISKEMKGASKLMIKIYGKEFERAKEMAGAAKIADEWVLSIYEEIKND